MAGNGFFGSLWSRFTEGFYDQPYDQGPQQQQQYADEGYEQGNGYYYEEPAYDDRPLNEVFGDRRAGAGDGGNLGAANRQVGAGRGNLNNVVNMPVQRPQNYVLVSSKPDRLDDAQLVCEHLRNRHVVIVNVEAIDGREAQRIVDFIGGAVLALDGEIIDITNRIFAVAPSNVELLAIQKDPKARGFLSFGG